MSAEKLSETSSTYSYTTSPNSTQSCSSDGADDEIIEEEDFQEESLQEEFPEEEEYLEEEMHLEEAKHLKGSEVKGNDYGYETIYLPERQHLEEEELHYYKPEELLDENEYLEEEEDLEEEIDLEERSYLDEEEYLEDVEFKVTHSPHTTPYKRSPFGGSPKASSSYQTPILKASSQRFSHYTSPTFDYRSDGSLLAMTDQATQTKWTYKSKSAMLLKSKLEGKKEVSKAQLGDKMSSLEVMKSVSKTNCFEDLVDEPHAALEVEDLDDNFLNNTTYQAVFSMILKEMADRSELEEDIDIPLTGYLESETRRKLGILLKKNFEKYKETLLLIMRKRERMGTFTFRLIDKKPPEIKKPETKKVEKPRHIVRRKKKVELDAEWIQRKIKMHQGDGKVILYPSGTLFQVLFPDGTGQIHYPSGNLAMLILSTSVKCFTYIILEDSKAMWIRALINNSGHATFYDENRNIWMSLSQNLGYYFIEGGGQKAWNWWNLNLHVHAPPVQPVSLKINRYIKIQIRSQDNIFFYFLNQKKQIRLNLGTKYKYVTPETLNEMKKTGTQEVEFGPTAQKIQILLGKMSKILNLLSIFDLEDFVESAKIFLVKAFRKNVSWCQ